MRATQVRPSSHDPGHGETPRSIAYYSYHSFPSHRAHTIQVTSMCEAFQQLGVATTLFGCRSPERADLSESELLDEYGIQDRFAIRLFAPTRGIWAHRYLSFVNTYRTCREYEVCFSRSVIPALACALRGVRCIFEVHDYHLGVTDRAALAVLKGRASVRYVAISAELAGLLSARWGLPRERIAVAHDGFRPQSLASPSRVPIDYDTSRAHLRAVYVGSFYPGRGIELISQLAARHPDMDFILVGAPDDYTLPPACDRSGNIFVFRRIPHSSIPGVLEMGDMLLMPYGDKVTVDGQGDTGRFCSPLKLFEYLGAGRPIIASRLPSIEEVLVEGSNALLAGPGRLEEWSLRVAELKDNPGLRRRLAAEALRSSTQYTWLVRARRLLEESSRD